MPVHLYGHPADITRLGAVAGRHGLEIYEDAAQAHGAAWLGRPTGTFGLFPTKNMTSGEGEMVSCADAQLSHSIRIPDDRDGFARALATEHGVGTGVYYPVPSHRLRAFARTPDLPETERAAREVLSLPVHPALSDDDLAAIAAAVNAIAAAGS